MSCAIFVYYYYYFLLVSLYALLASFHIFQSFFHILPSPRQRDVEDPRTESLREYCYGLMLPIICALGIIGNVLNLIVLTRRNMRGTAYIYMRGKWPDLFPFSIFRFPLKSSIIASCISIDQKQSKERERKRALISSLFDCPEGGIKKKSISCVNL